MKVNQGVHPFFENKKQVAIIDNTDYNRIKVILTDRSEPYIQVFFVIKEFSSYVADTKQMRDLAIPSF